MRYRRSRRYVVAHYRFLDTNETSTAMRLAQRDYRPPEVIELNRRIASATEAAELQASLTGEIDMERVDYIVELRHQLDALYGDWIVRESRLS